MIITFSKNTNSYNHADNNSCFIAFMILVSMSAISLQRAAGFSDRSPKGALQQMTGILKVFAKGS